MRSALVGVIGHVDHGKSALVRALTGAETDRLAEEKARGLSIVLGFAVLRGGEAEIDLIDMPGHERFVRAMISGATGIDAVLLAVDANEGIKPQTVEHLDIAALVGVRRGVIALTKCDIAAPDRIEEVAAAVRALCEGAGLAAISTVETSAVTGRGIDKLAEALHALGEAPATPEADVPAYLPIDRSFSVKGFGSVFTGTLRGGNLTVGDAVEVVPGGRRSEIRGLQIHGTSVETVLPGRRVAVNLRGVELDELPRGRALATPESVRAGRWLDVMLTVPPGGDALPGGTVLSLLVGTSEVPARLRLLEGDSLAPGATTLAQLKCASEIAAPAGEPFILRVPSPARTVAGGRILDPLSRRKRRNDRAVLEPLGHLAAGRWREAALARLAQAGVRGIAIHDLAPVLRRGPAGAQAMLTEWGARLAGDRALDPEAWGRLSNSLSEAVASYCAAHPLEDGLPRAAVEAALAGTPREVAVTVADDVVGRGVLERRGGSLRPKAARPARDREQRLLREVETAFAAGGLTPPDEAEITGNEGARGEALRYLVRQGVLVRAPDLVQKRMIVFHREAIEEAKRRLAECFGGSADGFLAKEAGAVLGISRKFSIPLLEHLDRERFTRRSGDRRVLLRAEAGEEAG